MKNNSKSFNIVSEPLAVFSHWLVLSVFLAYLVNPSWSCSSVRCSLVIWTVFCCCSSGWCRLVPAVGHSGRCGDRDLFRSQFLFRSCVSCWRRIVDRCSSLLLLPFLASASAHLLFLDQCSSVSCFCSKDCRKITGSVDHCGICWSAFSRSCYRWSISGQLFSVLLFCLTD